MLKRMSNFKAVTWVYVIFGLVLSVQSRVLDRTDGADFEEIDEMENIFPAILRRAIGNLLVSEYNRVTSTNERLYMLSRDPYMLCESTDLSSCVVSVELELSTCNKHSTMTNCQALQSSKDETKMCVGSVDLLGTQITNPLTCQDDDSDQGFTKDEDVDERKLMSSKMSYNNPRSLLKSAEKKFKKQWGRFGANIYPL